MMVPAAAVGFILARDWDVLQVLEATSTTCTSGLAHLAAVLQGGGSTGSASVLGTHADVLLERLLQAFVAVYTERSTRDALELEQLTKVLVTCERTNTYIQQLQADRVSNEEELGHLELQTGEALDALAAAAAEEIVRMVDEGMESDDDEHMLTDFVNRKQQGRRRQELHGIVRTEDGLKAYRLQEMLERVASAQARLTVKRLDAVRSLVNPPRTVKLVMDAVLVVLRRNIGDNALERRGQAEFRDAWDATVAHLQDPSFLAQVQGFQPWTINDELVELVGLYTDLLDVTVEKARHASKDAAAFLEWVLSLLDFHCVRSGLDAPSTG
jgi:hypothetical protein